MHGTYGRLLCKSALIGAVIEAPFAAWLLIGFGMHSISMMILGMFHLPSLLLLQLIFGQVGERRLSATQGWIFGLGVPVVQAFLIALVAFFILLWREKRRASHSQPTAEQ